MSSISSIILFPFALVVVVIVVDVDVDFVNSRPTATIDGLSSWTLEYHYQLLDRLLDLAAKRPTRRSHLTHSVQSLPLVGGAAHKPVPVGKLKLAS